MVPGGLVVAADEDSRGVTIWLLLLSKSNMPTAAEGQLDVTVRSWRAGEGPCVALKRQVSLDDFTIERSGPVFPVLVLSPLSLHGTPCAARLPLAISVRFHPRRGARAAPGWGPYGNTSIYRPPAAVPSDRSPAPPRPEPALSPRPGDRSWVERVITAHLDEVRRCYERELLHQPVLEGKLVVEWIITPSGLAARVRRRYSTIGSPRLESCILEAIRRWRFPRPHLPLLVGYPFVLRRVAF